MSDDGLSLSASVAVNKQILKVILMLGNDAIYSWYANLMPVIIFMHIMAHSAISIRLALCKINEN